MAAKKPIKKTPTKKEIDEAAASVEAAIEKLEVEEVETEEEIVVGEETPAENPESEEQEESSSETSDESVKEEEKEDAVESPEEPSKEPKDEEVESSDAEKEESSESSDTGTVFSRRSFEEEKSGSGPKMIIMICLIIIFTILGFVGGYFYGKGSLGMNTSVPENTETVPTFTPTPTEAEEADLSAYSIEILNGSGVAGVAGTEQEALETDGFSVENTGNAENQDFSETVIAVKSDVSEEYIEKLRDSLSERYVVADDTEELEDDNDYDVVITIGSETVVDE